MLLYSKNTDLPGKIYHKPRFTVDDGLFLSPKGCLNLMNSLKH